MDDASNALLALKPVIRPQRFVGKTKTKAAVE
jgi:hypothetical protein